MVTEPKALALSVISSAMQPFSHRPGVALVSAAPPRALCWQRATVGHLFWAGLHVKYEDEE